MVCKPASQRDAVWAYGSSGEEMLGATCSWVTGDGRWEAHSQPWLSFFGPSGRRLHPWGFPKVGDASKLSHSAVVLSPSRNTSSTRVACCKGQD